MTSTVHATSPLGVLEGTLELPEGCGPFPTVLVIAGSGPTDRDGNVAKTAVSPNSYALLAAALASQGVASVRYDKAGIGASVRAVPRTESELRFDTYVDGAVAWLDEMRKNPSLGAITVVGHSEGALIGLLATKRAAAARYVSLAGAGRPIGPILHDQLSRALTDATLLARADEILAQLTAGNTVADVPSELSSVFRPSVQPYLISWMKLDPAAELRASTVPTLIVQGTTDTQVAVSEARLLAAAKPDATLDLVEGMCHVLKAATLAQSSQSSAYTDPSLPVVEAMTDAIAAFAKSATP